MAKKDKAPTHGPEYEKFGQNLALARTELGLSQSEIAKALNMNQSTYAGYETGTRKIPLSVIIQLSDFFEKTPDELILGKQNYPILNYEDSVILEKYHSLSPEGKEIIHGALGLSREELVKISDTKSTKLKRAT